MSNFQSIASFFLAPEDCRSEFDLCHRVLDRMVDNTTDPVAAKSCLFKNIVIKGIIETRNLFTFWTVSSDPCLYWCGVKK